MSGVPLARQQLHRFFFGFLIPLRVVLGAFWGTLGPSRSFGRLLSVVWGPLKVLWEPFGGPFGSFGRALGVLWAPFGGPLAILWGSGGRPEGLFGGLVSGLGRSVGVHGGSFGFLVASGSVSGSFRDIPGGQRAPFWDHFSMIFRYIFQLRFLIDFGRCFDACLEAFCFFFLEAIFDTFQDFSEKGELHENTVNMQSDWGSGAYQNDQKSAKN